MLEPADLAQGEITHPGCRARDKPLAEPDFEQAQFRVDGPCGCLSQLSHIDKCWVSHYCVAVAFGFQKRILQPVSAE
jgi:hypothetical protein